MLILNVNAKNMVLVGGLIEFLDRVFIKRNWDLFLNFVLSVDNENLITLLQEGILKEASQKVDIWVSSESYQKHLKYSLSKIGIKLVNLESYNNAEIINYDPMMDCSIIDNLLFKILDFKKDNGLIPTVVQDQSKNVLMLAYSSKNSLKVTLETRQATYFSRSRNQIWIKGERSGNYQDIKRIYYDCDADSLLFSVKQLGFACHKGTYSCFQNERFSISSLYNIIIDRIENSKRTESYSKELAEDKDLLLKKIQEETREVINYTDRENLIWEIADLTYFILVLMAIKKVSPDEIINELRRRHR